MFEDKFSNGVLWLSLFYNNDFALQNQPQFVTLQLYLSEIRSLFPTAGSENIYCAAAILGMLPLVIIYCCMQKYFIEGVATGGVKE